MIPSELGRLDEFPSALDKNLAVSGWLDEMERDGPLNVNFLGRTRSRR